MSVYAAKRFGINEKSVATTEELCWERLSDAYGKSERNLKHDGWRVIRCELKEIVE